MRTKEWVAALCFALLTAADVAGTDPRCVGPVGRPASLVIKGANTFSPEEIREALFDELDVVTACNPDGPLEGLTAVIARKTTAGYRAAGFCDISVSVVRAGEGLVMTIVEGDRYTSGDIEVSGNHQVEAEGIRAALIDSATTLLKPRPLWEVKEPASFGPETDSLLASKALTAVNDQGCYRAKVTATVEPDGNTKQATLRVKIDEEGPLSTLADVETVGNKRDSREALITYLQLDQAVPLARERREEIERRLLASGRFVVVHWELGKPDDRGDSWRPRLVLEEYEAAQPLDQPLTREEAALLKLAEWFRQLDQSDEELVSQDRDEQQVIVVAPRRGWMALLKGPDDEAASRPGFDYAVVMDEGRVGLYSRWQQRKIVAEPPPSPFAGEIVLNVVNGSPHWDGQGTIKLGGGLSTEVHKGYCRHVEAGFRLSPTAALSLLYKHKAACGWDGDVLSLEWDKGRLRANAITGQLIEHVSKTDPTTDGGQAVDNLRLSVKPGEFDRRLREIETASAEWRNVADSGRPLSCLGEFVCPEMERFTAWSLRNIDKMSMDLADGTDDPEAAETIREIQRDVMLRMSEGYRKSQRGYAALGKAISLGLLEPFDHLIGQRFRPPKEESSFSIPLPQFDVRASSLAEFRSLVRQLAPLLGVRVGNFLFPGDTWTSSAWRLGLFTLAKKPIPSTLSARGVGKRGPLFSLAAAESLHAVGHDFEARMHVILGAKDSAAFGKECRELVTREGFVHEVLLRTAGTMRQLSAADVVALVHLLVEFQILDETQAVAAELAALRAHAADSPTEAATDALDALWRAGLSKWIERRLDKLKGNPPKGLPEKQPEA